MNSGEKREVRRGDIYFANFGVLTSGSEQHGFRPVLIVQNDVGNTYSTTTMVAFITSSEKKKKSFPTHMLLNPKDCGLSKESVVLLEQLRTIDKNRLVTYVGKIPSPQFQELDQKLKISLGIT